MGLVTASARIESLKDLYEADRGSIGPAQIRTLDAILVHFDETVRGLLLPLRMIARLGLRHVGQQPGGSLRRFEAVRITILDHDGTIDVMESPPDDDFPRFGAVVLTLLDLIVDPIHHRLIGNPDHGGEQRVGIY